MNIQVLEIQDHQVETAIIQIKEEKTEESEEEIEKEESKE